MPRNKSMRTNNHNNQSTSAGQSDTVLVVEDDAHISFVLQYMLGREGFEVVTFDNGLDAGKAIEHVPPPCLVLLDVMLPHEDGIQLLQRIRRKESWNDVPVVMLTARSQEKDVTKALEAGANDYVLKPFRPAELVARIRRLIA